MSSASFRLQFGCWVGPAVQHQIGSELARQFELIGKNVDSRDVHAHRLGVLNRHVAEPANARDDHPFSRPDLGLFQTLIDGDARAQDRRRGTELEVRR